MSHSANWFIFWSVESRLKKDVQAHINLCYKRGYTELNGFAEGTRWPRSGPITNMETLMS